MELPSKADDPRNRIGKAMEIMNADELEVLAMVAERLAEGQKAYGLLDINADGRDFVREAIEEMVDGSVYLASEMVRLRRG